LGAQPLDDVPIVHDLMAHIDRRAVFLERPLDDLDGSFDAGTEATRLGQHHSQHPRHLLDNATATGGHAGSRALVAYPCHSSRGARNAATLLYTVAHTSAEQPSPNFDPSLRRSVCYHWRRGMMGGTAMPLSRRA